MADGIWIRHPTARSQLCLVELRDRPYYLSYGAGVCDGRNGRPHIPAPITDCYCGVAHPCKTVHVDVDDTGAAMVSQGVLDWIRSCADETGFEVVGHTHLRIQIDSRRPYNVPGSPIKRHGSPRRWT